MSSMDMLLPTTNRKELATHHPKYDYANEDDIVNKLIDRVASPWYIYWHIVELTFSKFKFFIVINFMSLNYVLVEPFLKNEDNVVNHNYFYMVNIILTKLNVVLFDILITSEKT